MPEAVTLNYSSGVYSSPTNIGLSLVSCILETHETAFVYAGGREPEKAYALKELEVKYPGRIAVVKYVSSDSSGNVALAKAIDERHGHLDTVIANAGTYSTLYSCSTILTLSFRNMERHCKRRRC